MTTLKQTLLNFVQVLDKIEENGGEISDNLLPEITLNEIALQEKVDSYVDFIECVQAQLDKQQDLKKKIEANIKTLKALEDRLKDNAKYLLQAHDILELSGNTRKMKLQNAGGQQALVCPKDMFLDIKIVDDAYIGHFPLDSLEKKTVFTIESGKFKTLVKENFIHDCYFEERKKCLKLL